MILYVVCWGYYGEAGGGIVGVFESGPMASATVKALRGLADSRKVGWCMVAKDVIDHAVIDWEGLP